MHYSSEVSDRKGQIWRSLLGGCALLALAACQDGFDMDVRGGLGGFSTTDAARRATVDRPAADDSGVISYPNYQVAVARRNDSVADVAQRVGLDAQQLATYNGLRVDDRLRDGEILALPSRVAEPSPATGAAGTGPILPAGQVDIGALAGAAIDRAGDQRVEVATLPAAQSQLTGPEPVRHKVERGETAYTISRLYQIPVKSLAEWNGLGSDFAIREGQYLIIPLKDQSAPNRQTAESQEVSAPGQSSQISTPPSASKPLPQEELSPASEGASNLPSVTVPEPTRAAQAPMSYPIQGKIVKTYSKGRNDGIDISGGNGSEVKAAESGTVAAITKDSQNTPILVIRHDPQLLTIYSGVDAIKVSKGQRVKRGEVIAAMPTSGKAILHFEVRNGYDSLDPLDYLN